MNKCTNQHNIQNGENVFSSYPDTFAEKLFRVIIENLRIKISFTHIISFKFVLKQNT